MRWFWQSKEPEIDRNEPEIDIEARFTALDAALKELSIVINRIDQRHYKSKVVKSNGDLQPDNEAIPDDFSWMRGK